MKISYLIALVTLLSLIGDMSQHLTNFYVLSKKVKSMIRHKINPEEYFESKKDKTFEKWQVESLVGDFSIKKVNNGFSVIFIQKLRGLMLISTMISFQSWTSFQICVALILQVSVVLNLLVVSIFNGNIFKNKFCFIKNCIIEISVLIVICILGLSYSLEIDETTLLFVVLDFIGVFMILNSIFLETLDIFYILVSIFMNFRSKKSGRASKKVQNMTKKSDLHKIKNQSLYLKGRKINDLDLFEESNILDSD